MTTTLNAPDKAVCLVLDAANVGGLVLGQNLFRGPVREPSTSTLPTSSQPAVPHQAVFVLTTGGELPSHNHDNTDELHALLIAVVRGNPGRFEDGQDLARAVWRTIQRNVPAGYYESECTESEPRYLGCDDTEHHQWAINIRLKRTE